MCIRDSVIAVGGTAGGGAGASVVGGVDVVTAVGMKSSCWCVVSSGVDVDVTAVVGRAGIGAGVSASSGVDADVTAVEVRADGVLVCPTAVVSTSL